MSLYRLVSLFTAAFIALLAVGAIATEDTPAKTPGAGMGAAAGQDPDADEADDMGRMGRSWHEGMGMGMPGMGMQGMGMPGMGMQGGMWGREGWTCSTIASAAEGRLAFQKSELKVNSGQESLWQAYADAARGAARDMVAHCESMKSLRGKAPPSLPDRLALHEEAMAKMLDATRAIGKALRPLYDAFDATQKQAADRILRGPGPMMGAPMMNGPMMGGPMGGR